MKKLHYFLFAIGLLLTLIFIAGTLSPKEYYYSQQVSIRSDVRTTYRQLATLDRWRSWEPWSTFIDKDTFVIEGLDGKLGTKALWENITKQPEYISIEDIITNERLKVKLRLSKPFDAIQKITFELEPISEKIVLHAKLEGQCPFPFNVFRMLNKPENKLCALLDEALMNIKTNAENADRTFSISGRRVYQTNINAKNYCVRLYLPPETKFESMNYTDVIKEFGQETDSSFTMTLAYNVPIFNTKEKGIAVVSKEEGNKNTCDRKVLLDSGLTWLSTAIGSEQNIVDARKSIHYRLNAYQYDSKHIQLHQFELDKKSEVISSTMTFPLISKK